MKLALYMNSAAALRKLAEEIPAAIDNIVFSTERLLAVYQSLSDTLGVHEAEFYEMILSVKRAKDVSCEAVAAISEILTRAADKIERYVGLYSADSGSRIENTPTEALNEPQGDELLVVRTIIELAALRYSLELTDGDPCVMQLGGAYRDVKKSADSALYEAHHIPPQCVFDEKRYALPAIAMLKEDHAKTSSFRWRMNKAYQSIFPDDNTHARYKESVLELLSRGMLAEAVRNEVYEIRESFGARYDSALRQYLDYLTEYLITRGIPAAGIPRPV